MTIGTALNFRTTTSQKGKRFQGGLVFKAHRLVYYATLGLRVIEKKRRRTFDCSAAGKACSPCNSPWTACVRIWGFGFRISGFRPRILGFGFQILVFGIRISGFGFRISGSGFLASGFGFWDSGSGSVASRTSACAEPGGGCSPYKSEVSDTMDPEPEPRFVFGFLYFGVRFTHL